MGNTEFSKKDYIATSDDFERVWRFMKKHTRPTVIEEVCYLRGYEWQHLYDELEKTGIAFLDDPEKIAELKKYENPNLGLFSKRGNFILEGRYVTPIRDPMGRIVALVGWLNDTKKYVTTPSKYFSKSSFFFGMEKLKYDKTETVAIVEGIFDTITLRSCGVNVLGTMGSDVSAVKQTLYSLFRKVVGIPDSDRIGRSSLRENKWGIYPRGNYLMWDPKVPLNGEIIQMKDVDELTKHFEPTSIKKEIDQAANSHFKTKVIEFN